MRCYSKWQWHLDEVFVKINGETHYLWRAVDHEGEVLECYVSKRRDRKAALKFLRKLLKRHGRSHVIVTDKLPSYGAAMKQIGNLSRQEAGHRKNNRAEIHINRFDDESGQCSVSAVGGVGRNSSRFILPPTIISITNVTLSAETISNETATPP